MRRSFKELLLPLLSLPPFPKHDKHKKEPKKKGGVDFILLSLSTSPHPTPPFYALPPLLDSRLPYPSAGFGQSHKAVARVGPNPLVDIVPLFIFQ